MPIRQARFPELQSGVPTAGVDDFQRFGEIVVPIQQSQNDQAVIRHDMAIAAIGIVAILV